MKELPYPQKPIEAYQNACVMAEKLGQPLYLMCKEAKLSYSTFCRWGKGNQTKFDSSVYDALVDFVHNRVKKLKPWLISFIIV